MTFSKEWFEKHPDFNKGKNNPASKTLTGKKFEEIYGEEKAKEIKKKISLSEKGKPKPWLKGKTWEELYGKERAKEMKRIKSEQMKGKNNHLFGKKRVFSKEWLEKIRLGHIGIERPKHSKRMSGENNPFYGKKHSKEQKEKWSSWHKEHSKKMWQNQEYKEKVIKATFKALQTKPNKKEQFLIELFKKNNLPYNFVGDGKVIIDGKCPDFINVNGQKKLIEFFGEYWHKRRRKIQYHQTETGRIEHYAKYGYETLVIWEKELKNKTALIEKINNFEGKIRVF